MSRSMMISAALGSSSRWNWCGCTARTLLPWQTYGSVDNDSAQNHDLASGGACARACNWTGQPCHWLTDFSIIGSPLPPSATGCCDCCCRSRHRLCGSVRVYHINQLFPTKLRLHIILRRENDPLLAALRYKMLKEKLFLKNSVRGS